MFSLSNGNSFSLSNSHSMNVGSASDTFSYPEPFYFRLTAPIQPDAVR